MSARGKKARYDDIAEMFEGDFVTEEKRLIGCHCLDHLLGERFRIRSPYPVNQLGNTRESRPAGYREKSALDQIFLVGREHETGALPQKSAQVIVVGSDHRRPPQNRRTIFDAI